MAADRLKIVVFGAFNAGKSSFIQALDPETRHIEAKTDGGTTTIAFDFGRIQLHGRRVYLFGTPGQERFEFVRRIIARDMDGAIIVVDATAEIDEMTLRLFEWLSEQRVPVAIVLNKCDMKNAAPERFRGRLGDTMLHAVSAKQGKGVHEAVSAFVASIVAP
ncbi:MAG: 50S ribosome-binding GTPase [Methanomicrobiaceae archaeon]|uniref:Putative atp/gtp-binding protein n=1 Tax=hydrocarbon metagenome TaxID=938273 RepID=A0A0W8FIB7_9ZZZZ|nr:50S ribosome-binding GTPase [Methanomicrobiaceae archaeon]MDD5419151.1 50S ribosome-binding GTPase [Methanomicrobiaceae archaeon]